MSPPSPAGGGSNKWRPGLSGAAAKARAKELRKAGEARAAAARLAKRERQAAVPRRSSKAERRRAAAAGAAAADAAAGELRRLSVARGTADHGPNHAAPESTKERVLASALLPDVLWQRVLGEAGARACCAAARSCTDLRRAACARGVWDALARGVFGDARDTFANGGAHSAAAGRRDAQARRRSEEDVTTSELRRAVRRSELRAAAWEGLASGRHTDEARWGDVGGLSASTLWQDGTVGLAAEGRQLRLFEVSSGRRLSTWQQRSGAPLRCVSVTGGVCAVGDASGGALVLDLEISPLEPIAGAQQAGCLAAQTTCVCDIECLGAGRGVLAALRGGDLVHWRPHDFVHEAFGDGARSDSRACSPAAVCCVGSTRAELANEAMHWTCAGIGLWDVRTGMQVWQSTGTIGSAHSALADMFESRDRAASELAAAAHGGNQHTAAVDAARCTHLLAQLNENTCAAACAGGFSLWDARVGCVAHAAPLAGTLAHAARVHAPRWVETNAHHLVLVQAEGGAAVGVDVRALPSGRAATAALTLRPRATEGDGSCAVGARGRRVPLDAASLTCVRVSRDSCTGGEVVLAGMGPRHPLLRLHLP